MNLFESEFPPIMGFRGKYSWLSNFHPCICVWNSIPFTSSEHVFMYQKSNDYDYRLKILMSSTGAQAKKIGKTAVLRPDWDTYKLIAMTNALKAKFADKDLAQKLIDTGDAHLEETNVWHDTYWGVCEGEGQNMLGRILMNLRTNLQK
jgi:ribA/ribD-fused uncharacterized protein